MITKLTDDLTAYLIDSGSVNLRWAKHRTWTVKLKVGLPKN